MTDRSGPKEGLRGVVEDVKGKAKEAWASLTDDEKMEREAEAQQRKAEAQREAAREEAEAERARIEAAAHEAEQRAQQDH